EDDPHYARILLGLARDKGFKGVVALKGAIGLNLARQLRPTAISLDIFLPDMLGWTVLNQLKLDPATRHIPVQIVTLDEERQHGLARGAFAYLVKEATTDRLEAAFERIKGFASSGSKRLLVVEDNADDEVAQLKALAKSIVLKDVQSPERLLDETALFLHRVVTDLPAAKQEMLQRLHGSNEVLRGRKVLVVDDDARNIFALTSL